MVQCTKCGTENEEGAKFCSNYGSSFTGMEYREKHPRMSASRALAILGFFIGVIMTIWGFANIYVWHFEIWNWVILAFGLLLVLSATSGLKRNLWTD